MGLTWHWSWVAQARVVTCIHTRLSLVLANSSSLLGHVTRCRVLIGQWSPGHVQHDGLQLQPQLGLGPGLELGARHGAGRPRHQVRELGHAAAASHQHHVARRAGLGGAWWILRN